MTTSGPIAVSFSHTSSLIRKRQRYVRAVGGLLAFRLPGKDTSTFRVKGRSGASSGLVGLHISAYSQCEVWKAAIEVG